MAKTCPKCGRLTDDRYVFCGFCGTLLDAPQPEPAPQSFTYPQPVPQPIPPSVPVTNTFPAKKKKHIGLIIGIFAFLVIAGVAVAVLLIFLNGGGKPQSPQEVIDRIIDTALDGEYEKTTDCIYEYRYSDELKQEVMESMKSLSSLDLKSLGIDKDAVKSLVSIKVGNTEEATVREGESIRSTLSETGVPTDPINRILRAEVRITLMGSSESAALYFAETDDGCFLLSSAGEMNDFIPQLDEQEN